jgi:hypothetical protein
VFIPRKEMSEQKSARKKTKLRNAGCTSNDVHLDNSMLEASPWGKN